MHHGVSASTSLTHESVRVCLRACKTRCERLFYEIGGLLSQFAFFVFNSDLATATCALLERVYYHEVDGRFAPPFKPTFNTVSEILLPFARVFDRMIVASRPVALDQYFKVYTGRRREVYERATSRVMARGFRKSDAYLSSFVKAEKAQFVTGKRIVPRLIQPRKPEYNVCVGRYIRHLEHEIFNMIGRVFGGFGPVVQKGFNSFQRAQNIWSAWSRIRHPVAIGLDASRFDQHINPALLTWEHGRYLGFYSGDDRKELSQILKAQIENRGFLRTSEGDIKYKVDGGRMSGDMNTSLGNCLIMCGAVYSYMDFLGIPLRDFALINDGDDCVLIVHSEDARIVCDKLPAFFAKIGLIMKVEHPVYKMEDIAFCQTHPVFDGHQWRCVRNFPECMSKDATVLKDITHPEVYPRYFRAIGDCGLALTCGMPVLQEYYEALRRSAKGTPLTDPVFETGMARLAYGLSPKYLSITVEARVSFYNAFGVLPDVQIELEEQFRVMKLEDLQVYHEPATRTSVPFACSSARL